MKIIIPHALLCIYMIISFLVGLLETKFIFSFSSGIPSMVSTIFWNIVLFLQDKIAVIFS